uniref:Uncharacterized protein n=1 Tax=Denticeps clupeoides TaxID=299321 RepID=A0AAY4B2P8_9TELE
MQEKTTCRVVFCNRSHSAAGFIGRATFSVWSHNSHRRRNGIRLDRRCGELEVDMSMGRDLWHLSAAELWDLLEDPGRTDRMVRVSVKKFMEGLLPLEWFVEPFLSCRKVYHVRQVQADKLQELLTPPEMPRDHHRLHRPPRSLSLYPNILPAITPPVVHCCFTTYLLKGPYLPPLDPHCQDQRPSPPQNALTTRRLYSHPSKNHQLFRHRR